MTGRGLAAKYVKFEIRNLKSPHDRQGTSPPNILRFEIRNLKSPDEGRAPRRQVFEI